MSESYYRCKECGSFFESSAQHWQAWDMNVPVECQEDEEPEVEDIQHDFCSLPCLTTWTTVRSLSGEVTADDFQ